MYKNPAKTLIFGKNLFSVAQCASTNTELAALARANLLDEGAVLIAEAQTAGRGWGAHTRWEAEPGQNLTFSLLLRPVFLRSERHFLLSAAVAVGIHSYLRRWFGERAFIKWPNDLLVDRQKICGVLIENQIRGGHFVQSIVGIGLNVNQLRFEAPAAASMQMLAGRPFDLNDALADVLAELEGAYEILRLQDAAVIRRRYTEALFGLGEPHIFQRAGDSLEAVLQGVDEVGRLQLEANGKMLYFDAKEIRLLL